MGNETQTLDGGTFEKDDWDDIVIDGENLVDDNEETPEGETPPVEGEEKPTVDGEETLSSEGNNEEKPEGEEAPPEAFTLKYMGEEKSVSKEDIIPLAQKGMDYDMVRQKFDELSGEHTTLATENTTLKAEKAKADKSLGYLEELSKGQGFPNIDAFIDELCSVKLANSESIDISAARSRISLDRRERDLAAKEAELLATKHEPEKPAERDIGLTEFIRTYPKVDPNTIPNDVWDAVKNGDSLSTAYGKFEAEQVKAENARLKAQLEAKEKEKENKNRSTGSRNTVGKTPSQDDFDKFWNED